MTPPPTFKLPHTVPAPACELDITLPPSPPRLPQLNHTPPRLSSSPTPVESIPEQCDTCDDITITAHIVRHDSSPSNQEPAHDVILPLPRETEEAEEEEEEERDTPPQSWSSPPQQQGEREGEAVNEQVRSDEGLAEGKVEQLTKMVETLSAKFVLLETRLRLAQAQVEGNSLEPAQAEDSLKLSTTGEREEGEREHKRPLRDVTAEMNQLESSRAKPAARDESMPSPSPQRDELTTPLFSGGSRRDYLHRYTSHMTKAVISSPSTVRLLTYMHSVHHDSVFYYTCSHKLPRPFLHSTRRKQTR